MRLLTDPDLASLSGGAAIERLAELGDAHQYDFPATMKHSRNCDFSFSGLQAQAKRIIELEETKLGKILSFCKVLVLLFRW